MKDDLEIIDLDKDLNTDASSTSKEDLTVTKAQAKVEELERELQRLKEAKAAQSDAPEIESDEIPVVEATEGTQPEQEIKRRKTNAEAYASSEKNVADMLAEYDAIASDDRRLAKEPKNKRPVEIKAKEHVKAVSNHKEVKQPAPHKKVEHVDRKQEDLNKKVASKKQDLSNKKVASKKQDLSNKKVASKKHKPDKKSGFLSNLSGMDYVIGLTGVLVLVAAIVTFSIYSAVKTTEAQIAAFIPVGENMAEIGIAGESALLAMADNREDETIVIEEEEEYTVAEYDEKDDASEGNVTVNLKLQTVVKDLKIKFVNKSTGKLVPGVPFQVEITDAAKKTINKTDDDKDGIIYIKSIAPGEAKVKMVALTGYDAYALPSDVQTIIIKETLDYKKIDVADEVKTEAQVNVAAEDTAQATVTESELKDTVEWVESTRTAVDGSGGYVTVSRDEIDSVPDAVKNGKPDNQAKVTGMSVKARELCEGISDLWSLKVYAEENVTTTEEQQTSSEQPSSEQPPESSENSSEQEGEIDWGHKLTINGIRLYVDKECTTIATYADYAKQSEFYCPNNGSGGGAAEYKYTGWQTLDGVTYFFDKEGNKVTGDQVIQGAKYSFGSDGALKTGSGVLGIDVSKWNGSIDWKQVKNSGISYVIIRCGYRGSTTGALIEDPTFRTNIKGAQAAGLKVGVYFFTQAVDEVEAVEEASMTLSLISGYKLSYPVFLDVEGSGGRGDKIDSATRTKVINAYCQTIKNSGYSAGVYANRTWLSEKFSPGSLGGCKIWLAQYAATPTYGGTYQMWQYTSKGTVGGIKGNVDMNLSYLNY